MQTITKKEKRTRRHARIRARVFGTAERPRLSVFRSNKYVYAQLIDDANRVTLGSATSLGAKKKGSMREQAALVGNSIAEVAKTKKIAKVVFDRGGFLYAGVIRAIADAARSAGLEF